MTTKPKAHPRRVLIIEDDAKYVSQLREVLDASNKLHVIDSTESFEEGVALARRHRPDIVLFDLILQSVDQTDRIFRIKEASAKSLVVAMTGFPDRDRIFRALLAGADGYVWKTGSTTPVVAALDEIKIDGFPLSRDVARVIRKHFHQQGMLARKFPFSKLSVRQRKIVNWICEGFTNDEIAKELGTSEDVVKSECKQVCRTLNVPNRARIAAVVGQFVHAFRPSPE